MPITVLIGAQWGDEGKGRFVDALAADANIVARYAGGDNAGHTVAVGSTVYKMHLIPSGVLHPGVVSVMGNGMVVNPVNLVKEINQLRDMGVSITPENLVLSSRAHLITPAHIARDRASEQARGAEAIGTTLRGIGPAYMDKTSRDGLRVGQMLDLEAFGDALHSAIERASADLVRGGFAPLDARASVPDYLAAAQTLQPFIQETAIYLHHRLKAGATVIGEGAQGTLLDIDHGSYPFVTSSSPTVGGALTGLGVSPLHINRIVGIAKAFSTRVGSGPMPTEQANAIGDRLRGTGANYWDEFGTTTGRPRRCGWLDTVMLRYSAAVNGYTELALTKLDVLSGFEELPVAVAYEYQGQRLDYPPPTTDDLDRVIPIYETLPGWHTDLSGVRHAADLPPAARRYLERIAELVEVPVTMVSVGPERRQMITL
ncbi:MAG: adenylosuccinate synthase [Anaerolineae bacterium]|nr:adenylosuccinate synthase [Anaerolineae bacterium]